MAEDFEVVIRTYILELYNNDLVDLLATAASSSKGKGNQASGALGSKKLPAHLEANCIKKDKKGMVYVKGATVTECPDLQSLKELYHVAESHRHVGATKMNAGSSRSHFIMSILIESTHRQSGALPASYRERDMTS